VSDLKVEIVNVVATASLNQKVNLDAVAELEQAFYHLEVYHCAYIKDKDMKGKVSVFASGKMISLGTKSEKEASKDLNHVTKLLADTKIIKPTKIHPGVQNVVAVATLKAHPDLERIAETADVIYEPEQFPAAIYRPPRFPKVTTLIFSSGKLIIAGTSSTKIVGEVAEELENFIKTSEVS